MAFALSPSFLPALVFLVVANSGQMLFMTSNNTVIQAQLPGEIRGRVVSVMMMSFGLTPVAVFPVSAAADAFGAPITIACAAALALALIWTLFALSAKLRDLRLDALEQMDLSPVQAAVLVAQGRISEEEAKRLSGARSMDAETP
jgi:hypothetical protein